MTLVIHDAAVVTADARVSAIDDGAVAVRAQASRSADQITPLGRSIE